MWELILLGENIGMTINLQKAYLNYCVILYERQEVGQEFIHAPPFASGNECGSYHDSGNGIIVL